MFNNWLTFSTSVFSDARKDFIYGDSTTDGASFRTQINAGTGLLRVLKLNWLSLKKCKHYVVFFVNATFDRKINTLNRPGVLTTNFQEV
jgi:hypothetical protein